MSRSRWLAILALLLTVTALALAGWWTRRTYPGGCALDGMAIEPRYRVRIKDEQGHGHEFCCIHCAALWLKARKGHPRGIYVTDETSGEEVEAAQAFFVRSSVVTKATTGSSIHVFRDRGDAEKHAATARGRVLSGEERPFSGYERHSQ